MILGTILLDLSVMSNILFMTWTSWIRDFKVYWINTTVHQQYTYTCGMQLAGQHNIQQRIQYHKKVKEENNTLREELSKLRIELNIINVRYERAKTDLARFRSAAGQASWDMIAACETGLYLNMPMVLQMTHSGPPKQVTIRSWFFIVFAWMLAGASSKLGRGRKTPTVPSFGTSRENKSTARVRRDGFVHHSAINGRSRCCVSRQL